MPAPRKFTREQLRTVALAMVDEQGLAALTMRSLASALGTGAMTIYNYVDGREGLEQLVTEAVMAEARWDDVTGEWSEAVTAVAVGMWRAVRAHPHAIPLILTRRSLDPSTLATAEALLGALAHSGRSGTDLLIAFRLVTGFITGSAQSELAGPLAEGHGDDPDAATGRVRSLSSERFPHLIAIARAATASDPEIEFRTGLRIILTGLAA
ncbi:TetR/AcrR family transcriptional regulator [Glycomyces algeriensis]|uniref:TetR family transcriptional regulator n=1 Tax=Glycomyces algeriensis TaxID=256037 RepID=A0A9W6LFJ7_9ACTN|nr:TetR/AcrR family transcriptional regulator [Glycomyces algeriensis]MDA1367142.1 TetR/AcrR family transcriptional regulator [Glycomyces algeriensis]MDR7348471.1 AcrR family transcriptional regulator [Glycomyces algeriensis]GLI41175.1 TetR family transcriptional regulator [Glycomyces algeriensis]